jgi:flagellar basal body rod protein FlgC
MISALNNALSGFNAATRQIAVNANNIANASSVSSTSQNGTPINTPYVPKQVVQSTLVTGGVSTTTKDIIASSTGVADNSFGNVGGITQVPNVDIPQQLIQSSIASYDAKANLSVIKIEEKNMKNILNIVS